MKKRFYVFSMLAAGMLLAGCSDELEGGQDGPNVVEGETGYVKVTISLPSTMGTRAENDGLFRQSSNFLSLLPHLLHGLREASDHTPGEGRFDDLLAHEPIDHGLPWRFGCIIAACRTIHRSTAG